jgi:histidyl-tRNA synthetase
MRQADRLGAAHAVILDEDGQVQLRDMRSGEQREIDLRNVVGELTAQ